MSDMHAPRASKILKRHEKEIFSAGGEPESVKEKGLCELTQWIIALFVAGIGGVLYWFGKRH